MTARLTMNDTIIAISSALTPALRGIIRISGPESYAVVGPFWEGEALRHGRCIQGQMAIGDWRTSVACAIYSVKGPRSYTGEDVVEVHTFSSIPLLDKLAEQFIAAGARPAQPGEFTRRAFMAGRIDLAQAEAVQAVIAASDEAERRAAMLGLMGELSRTLQGVMESISQVLALVEAYLDFSEDEVGVAPGEEIRHALNGCLTAVSELTRAPSPVKNVTTVCIYGLANAGKSSLFNRLLQRDAALVSPTAGTTLDYLEGDTVLAGTELKFIDTPGIMENPSAIQSRALSKIQEILAAADIILYLIDGTTPFPDSHFSPGLPPVPVLFLKTKSDLPGAWSLSLLDRIDAEMMEISLYREKTIQSLRCWLSAKGHCLRQARETVCLNLRQHYIAREVATLISQALEAIAQNLSWEFPAVDLRAALSLLGELSGKVTTEDILDRIFSNFCIGK